MGSLLVAVKWNINGVDYTFEDYESINIRRSSDLEQNSCTIMLKNKPGFEPYLEDGIIQFSPDQPINVYAKIDKDGSGLDTGANSTDLVFNGRVASIDFIEDSSKSQIKLDCSDASFVALNKLWVGDESGTAPELVVKVIDFVNNNVSSSWDEVSAATTSNGGLVQDTNSSGGSFSSVKFSKVFKPVFEVIQDLSATEYTGDLVPYRFHLSTANVLSWFYPDDSAEHVINVGDITAQTITYVHPVSSDEVIEYVDSQIHRVLSYKLSNSIYDVVNYIIFKAGEDMEGEQVTNYAYNQGQGSPVVKDTLRTWEDIARDLKEEDRRAGNITKEYSDTYTYPSSYPLTPAWKNTSGTVADDNDYNEEFILEVTRRARARAEMEFKFHGVPKLKGTIELEGKSIYDANDGIILTATRTGIDKQFVRIKDVQHNIKKEGWFSTLTVEEEVPLIS